MEPYDINITLTAYVILHLRTMVAPLPLGTPTNSEPDKMCHGILRGLQAHLVERQKYFFTTCTRNLLVQLTLVYYKKIKDMSHQVTCTCRESPLAPRRLFSTFCLPSYDVAIGVFSGIFDSGQRITDTTSQKV